MASIARPAVFRQVCTAAPSKRVFSTRTTPLITSAFRTSKPLSRPTPSTIIRETLPKVASFHATASRPILPPPPQRIQGTANDPAPVPDPSAFHGAYHWTFERIMAAGLVPLTVAPFAAGSLNPITDGVLCAFILVHSHIGFQSCIIDYFPSKRTPKTRKGLMWLLNAATVLVGVGFYEFETNDVGLTEALKRIWHA
ncbi:succinate dehydrogenase-like protein [Patellaria atrata CBS 101060]|uniref:Succinate dehydrogenase [ubiquinone] cytochrome b small subunit n=1 Tax=Patellaria atrata CBS 101060 TaxID=1346257 RepID=A0A9P4SCI9_9PEZI|nr:succinate dehydrogenase-like protein [Patellaria atrata CBS 101060]